MEKIANDADYDAHFRRTFIQEPVESEEEEVKEEESWTLHDMKIPQGQDCKLVKIIDPAKEDFRPSEVADRLKFIEPTPVIVLAGAMTERAGRVMGGIGRVAFNTQSVVMDSGIASEVEKFCMRKKVPLIGVCPEAVISYPKINKRRPNELTNGHTHFFLIGKEDKSVKFSWGDESSLKYDLAKRITMGRKSGFGGQQALPCKIVTVVLGDNEESAIRDIECSLNHQIPIIILQGSKFCQDIIFNMN